MSTCACIALPYYISLLLLLHYFQLDCFSFPAWFWYFIIQILFFLFFENHNKNLRQLFRSTSRPKNSEREGNLSSIITWLFFLLSTSSKILIYEKKIKKTFLPIYKSRPENLKKKKTNYFWSIINWPFALSLIS